MTGQIWRKIGSPERVADASSPNPVFLRQDSDGPEAHFLSWRRRLRSIQVLQDCSLIRAGDRTQEERIALHV
jgi:hypothetical protein